MVLTDISMMNIIKEHLYKIAGIVLLKMWEELFKAEREDKE